VTISCSSFLTVLFLTVSNFGTSLFTMSELSSVILMSSKAPLSAISFIFSIGAVCDGSDCCFESSKGVSVSGFKFA